MSSLAVSGFVSTALRFFGGIIQGRFIGPETLGYYTKFTILPGYLFFLHLGVFTSLARQYPYFIGKGEKETASCYAANALGWTHLLCMIHTVIFSILCIWTASHGDLYATLGWGTQIMVSISSLYMFYLGSTYRNSNEFVTWSKALVISSITSVLLLPLVALYHFAGVCARYAWPNFVSLIYAHLHRPLKIKPQFNQALLKKMIIFGAPLMVFAYISTNLWDALTRTYILRMVDEKALGIFAFSGMLCTGITVVATSISQVFHPRIAMLYGSSHKDMAISFRYCTKCCIFGAALVLPFIGLTYWLIDPVINLFLPKYIECIPVTRYLCWLSLVPVIDLPKQLLIVAKKKKEFGISVVISFLLFVSLLSLFPLLSADITLEKIAIATTLCKLSSVFIANGFAWRMAWLESRSV